MKVIVCVFCFLLFAGFTVPGSRNNTNTWYVYLNGKTLLHSSRYKTGSTFELLSGSLKAGDTLGIHYNICGDYDHQRGYVSQLLFCKSGGEVIGKYVNRNTRNTGYRAEMPVSDLISQIKQEKDFELYFNLNCLDTAIKPHLVCRLKIR